jgi:phage terminase large subunit
MDLSNLSDEDHASALVIIQRCMVDRLFFFEEVLGIQALYRVPTSSIRDSDGGVGYTEIKLKLDDPIPEGAILIEAGVEEWQRQVMDELDQGETRISIRSAVGVGKTMLVSGLALHFVLFRDDVKCIVTSPSFSQLQDGIIPEVKKWSGRLPDWLKEQLISTTERVTRSPDNANNFISFRTARKETPEALQGIHATHVLLLVDEASGVHETVFEAGSGTMSTPGAITVLIGNPTRVTGLFYNTHKKLKALWKCFKVTSFDSTRVDPSFPKAMAETYGIDSLQYKIRCLGEFPEGTVDSVIPRAWVEAAVGRDILPSGKEMKLWGVDPGRGGDPTGFCERIGDGVTQLEEWNDANLMRVVGKVKRKWDDLPSSQRPTMIYVDVIGLGAGVADRLEELGLPVTAVNVAEMASMRDRYVRLRAELWDSARGFFEKKRCWISTKIDAALLDKFVEEASEPCYKDHSSGKVDVENKKDLKKRGVRSPNMMDAFCLTLAEDAAVMNGAVTDTGWGSPLNYKYSGVV